MGTLEKREKCRTARLARAWQLPNGENTIAIIAVRNRRESYR